MLPCEVDTVIFFEMIKILPVYVDKIKTLCKTKGF